MTAYEQKLNEAYEYIREKTTFVPDCAVVLGSGLGGVAAACEQICAIPFKEIPNFPVSTVEGHSGTLIFGKIGGVNVVLMQGRVHYYEGYTPQECVFPTRLLRLLGAKTLILTNAAGGVKWGFSAGDLMMITDQICMVPSPLIGQNLDTLGVRFPDMSEIYSKRLQSVIKAQARMLDIDLKEGVYIQLTGPQYETPSEIRMYRTWGADAVGMSTAIEAIAARHAGFEVAGISLISNLACGMSAAPLSHEEVQAAGAAAEKKFSALINAVLGAVNG